MLARPVVPLTPCDPLLVCKQKAPATSLESTLVQVLILKRFKLPGINTYEKGGGGTLGRALVFQRPAARRRNEIALKSS